MGKKYPVDFHRQGQLNCLLVDIFQRYQLNFLTDNVFEEDGTLIDRKLNVAMTRARKHLTIVGNPDILVGSAVYRRLMDFMKSRGCYFNVACEKFCAGDFSV